MGFATRLLAAAAAATVATLAVAIPATASPGSANGRLPFAAQASQAGLSPAQAATLQARVDKYVAKTGGTQVAANEIQVPGGDVLLALPGEKTARRLTAATATQASRGASGGVWCLYYMVKCCPYENFCAFSSPGGDGDEVDAYYCGDDVSLTDSFDGNGSYINYETPGTRAIFETVGWKRVAESAAAPYATHDFNWFPFWYVVAC